ncbi:predicted protein [Botrytis cinerea T4]|uniref:Uncharacterized protein n=1 Tax=Botryotinia fuckeliana (strain T4) TaxID=999810 RepID=G2Y1Y9_BOTF4|nr:predicted protein [Botrytis cinerea T4]
MWMEREENMSLGMGRVVTGPARQPRTHTLSSKTPTITQSLPGGGSEILAEAKVANDRQNGLRSPRGVGCRLYFVDYGTQP